MLEVHEPLIAANTSQNKHYRTISVGASCLLLFVLYYSGLLVESDSNEVSVGSWPGMAWPKFDKDAEWQELCAIALDVKTWTDLGEKEKAACTKGEFKAQGVRAKFDFPSIKMAYKGYGGDVFTMQDNVVTILGRFAELSTSDPHFCDKGTVSFLGCSDAESTKPPPPPVKCPGLAGILRGDGNTDTSTAAISVLDVAEVDYVALMMGNLANLLGDGEGKRALCEPKFIAEVIAASKDKYDKDEKAIQAGTWNGKPAYYSKWHEAQQYVLHVCNTEAKRTPEITPVEHGQWLWAAVTAGNAAFWGRYNVPFMFKSLFRGDYIRLLSSPVTLRFGTFEKEMNLLGFSKTAGGKDDEKGSAVMCGYEPIGSCHETNYFPTVSAKEPNENCLYARTLPFNSAAIKCWDAYCKELTDALDDMKKRYTSPMDIQLTETILADCQKNAQSDNLKKRYADLFEEFIEEGEPTRQDSAIIKETYEVLNKWKPKSGKPAIEVVYTALDAQHQKGETFILDSDEEFAKMPLPNQERIKEVFGIELKSTGDRPQRSRSAPPGGSKKP